MALVPRIEMVWVVELVNGFAPQARAAGGRESEPYPNIWPSDQAARRPSDRNLARAAEQLWEIFAASPSQRARTLNQLVRTTGITPRVDDDAVLTWHTNRRGRANILLASCAATLLGTVASHGWQKLGLCAEHDCQDVYFDGDGRGGRRYCSNTCLNRGRVRAYRERQAAV